MLKKYKIAFYKILYKILSQFVNQTEIAIIYGTASKDYLNLDCICQELQNRNRKFFKIDGNKFSISSIIKLAKSKVICVDQSTQMISNIFLCKNSELIQVWHAGGAFKKFGFDAFRKDTNQDKEEKRINRIHGQYDYVICSDQKLISIYAKAFRVSIDHVLPLGLPRTDLLYRVNCAYEKKFLTKKYHINPNKKWVLYAPTFRTTSQSRTNPMVPDFLLDLKKAGKIEILYKGHPSTKILNKKHNANWIDVSNEKSVNILSTVDILISDFSSIIFDYAFFNKPIVFFSTDSKEYLLDERGIYFDLNCYFSKVLNDKSTETVEDLIKPSSSKVWSNFMSSCDGKSSRRCCDFFEKLLVN